MKEFANKCLPLLAALLALVFLACPYGLKPAAPVQTASAPPTDSAVSASSAGASSAPGVSSKPKKNAETRVSEVQYNSSMEKLSTESFGEIDLVQSKTYYSPVSESRYHYATHLDERLKRAYRILQRAAGTMTVGMIELGQISHNEAALLFLAVRNDYPQYFWMPNQYVTMTKSNGNLCIALEYTDKTVATRYAVTNEQRIIMNQELNLAIERVDAVVQEASAGRKLSDYALELVIHDWLCANIEYDNAALQSSNDNMNAFSAYGALVQGKAVCEGYSRAAQLLLNYYGVPCSLLSGKSLNDGVGHLWNMVSIGGNMYHLDVTWDDIENAPYNHAYFNVPDTVILRDRTIEVDYSKSSNPGNGDFNYKLPACTATAANYYVQNKTAITRGTEVENLVVAGLVKAAASGRAACEYGFIDSYSLSEIESILDGLNFSKIINRFNRENVAKKIASNYSMYQANNGAFILYLY